MADSLPTVASVFTDHQLEDWAAEPVDAENIKRDALKRVDDALAPLRGSYAHLELFVQGGYANRTAVTAKSDVDIIVRWPGVFVGDSADDVSAASSYRQLRDDVLDTLRSRLDKGIPEPRIACRCNLDGRRIDVVPCLPYRVAGRDDIWFWPDDYYGHPIVSWPHTISELITKRDIEARGHFRPTVRALKGMRDDLRNGEDEAPSLVIESLVYTAWQAAERKRKVRTRCIAVLEAAVPLLEDLMDPARREHVTASQPTLDSVEGFVEGALARLR